MTDEKDALVRLVQAAITTHRDLHRVYGNTAACGGGIGGAAITQHCGVVCGYSDHHEAENDRWHEVERAYFRLIDGDLEWAESIPGDLPGLPSNPPGGGDRG